MMTNAPLTDYSTPAARAAALHRRRFRRDLLKQWQTTRRALDADSVAAILRISDTEWAAAQAKDAEGAEVTND
jgi:hypothetical protein